MTRVTTVTELKEKFEKITPKSPLDWELVKKTEYGHGSPKCPEIKVVEYTENSRLP